MPISDLQLLLAVSRRIDELSALDRLIQPEEFRLVRDLLVDIMEGYEHGYRRSTRRRVSRPRREFEWSRSQGFVAANSEPGQEYGVDLLAFYRSQPNGNHLAATITRVRGFIRPVFEANTLSFGNAGLRIANFDEDPLDISNIPINGPDEDWLAWFPAALITPATASFPAEYANWNEGGGWAVDVKAQRKLNGRQRSLWLFADPRPQGRTCGTTICLSV